MLDCSSWAALEFQAWAFGVSGHYLELLGGQVYRVEDSAENVEDLERFT